MEEPPKKTEIIWTKGELGRFIEGVRKEGKQWIKVQKYVKTQDIDEVRKEAKRFMKEIADEPSGTLAMEFSHLFKAESDESDEEMDSD